MSFSEQREFAKKFLEEIKLKALCVGDLETARNVTTISIAIKEMAMAFSRLQDANRRLQEELEEKKNG